MVLWLVFAVKKYFVRYRWTVCYSTCKKSPKQSVHSTLILIQLYCNFFFSFMGELQYVSLLGDHLVPSTHKLFVSCQLWTNWVLSFLLSEVSWRRCSCSSPLPFSFKEAIFFPPIVDFYSKCSIGLQSTHVWWQCVSAVSLTKALHSHFFCNTVVGKTLEGFHVLEAARAILYWFLVENIFMMWINKISEEIDIIFIYTGGGGRSSQKLLSITSPKP